MAAEVGCKRDLVHRMNEVPLITMVDFNNQQGIVLMITSSTSNNS